MYLINLGGYAPGTEDGRFFLYLLISGSSEASEKLRVTICESLKMLKAKNSVNHSQKVLFELKNWSGWSLGHVPMNGQIR